MDLLPQILNKEKGATNRFGGCCFVLFGFFWVLSEDMGCPIVADP